MWYTLLSIRQLAVTLLVAALVPGILSCASTPESQQTAVVEVPEDADYGEFPNDYQRIIEEWLDANIPPPECEGQRCSRTYPRIALEGQIDITEPVQVYDASLGAGWLAYARTYANEPDVMTEVHHLLFLRDGAVVFHKRGYLCFRTKSYEGGYRQSQRMCFEGVKYPDGVALPDL